MVPHLYTINYTYIHHQLSHHLNLFIHRQSIIHTTDPSFYEHLLDNLIAILNPSLQSILVQHIIHALQKPLQQASTTVYESLLNHIGATLKPLQDILESCEWWKRSVMMSGQEYVERKEID